MGREGYFLGSQNLQRDFGYGVRTGVVGRVNQGTSVEGVQERPDEEEGQCAPQRQGRVHPAWDFDRGRGRGSSRRISDALKVTSQC